MGIPNTKGRVYLTVTKLEYAPSALEAAVPQAVGLHKTLETKSGAAVQAPDDPIDGKP